MPPSAFIHIFIRVVNNVEIQLTIAAWSAGWISESGIPHCATSAYL